MKHIVKNILSLGLVTLAASCVGVLVTSHGLDNFQLIFIVGTMNISGMLFLVINKVKREN